MKAIETLKAILGMKGQQHHVALFQDKPLVKIWFPKKDCWIWVANDYHREGSFYISHSLQSAIGTLKIYNPKLVLPTKDVVDQVWEQANLRLNPVTLNPDKHNINSVNASTLHTQKINDQVPHIDLPRVKYLVAGHKKDIIRSQANGRVTIYGWHRQDGKPIQPVYSGHSDSYWDYSQALRPMFPYGQKKNGTWVKI